MKRFIGILLAALAMLAMVSCQTWNGAALRKVRSVAVVSIQFDRNVDVSGFQNYDSTPRGGWVKWADFDLMVRGLVTSADFDLAPAAATIDAEIFSVWPRSFTSAFVPERQVLDAPEYRALLTDGTKLLDRRAFTVPEGYVAIPSNAASVKVLAGRFPDADAFLWVKTTYRLLPRSELARTVFARMRADLTVTLFDRGGRVVLRHTESAEDSTDISVYMFGFSDSKSSAAAVRATAAASVEMARWLEGRAGR
jgi:hypothetical protein